MTQTTRNNQDSAEASVLNMALELSKSSWKVAFSDGGAQRPRVVAVAARDWEQLEKEVEKAKERFGLDGFWIHRVLLHRGIENIIVDPASIEVNRRSRRAKTDRLDAIKLVMQLIRHHRGEQAWSVERGPGARRGG